MLRRSTVRAMRNRAVTMREAIMVDEFTMHIVARNADIKFNVKYGRDGFCVGMWPGPLGSLNSGWSGGLSLTVNLADKYRELSGRGYRIALVQ